METEGVGLTGSHASLSAGVFVALCMVSGAYSRRLGLSI